MAEKLVRLRTYPHSRRYGVTITGLLVTVFPAGHPRYGDARATPSSKSQLNVFIRMPVRASTFLMTDTIHG
jgi:hypothetical protein